MPEFKNMNSSMNHAIEFMIVKSYMDLYYEFMCEFSAIISEIMAWIHSAKWNHGRIH